VRALALTKEDTLRSRAGPTAATFGKTKALSRGGVSKVKHLLSEKSQQGQYQKRALMLGDEFPLLRGKISRSSEGRLNHLPEGWG